MGDGEHQQRRRQRTAEGGRIDGEAAKAKHDGDEGRDCRPAGGAEYVWLGQRISQQDLHQHAGYGQKTADSKGGQSARQAQVHDESVGLVRARPAQCLQCFHDTDVRTARSDGKEQRGGRRDYQPDEQGSWTRYGQSATPGNNARGPDRARGCWTDYRLIRAPVGVK